jgi:hypothetical protein
MENEGMAVGIEQSIPKAINYEAIERLACGWKFCRAGVSADSGIRERMADTPIRTPEASLVRNGKSSLIS